MASRGKSWRANAVRVVLGLAVGASIAEVAFRVRDHGAFPHLNVYVPDARLGVRLEPGATEKIRFGSDKNPITSVRINRDGYRGEEWPAPMADEVLVVGDSQVFGLGVEDGDTFSAKLARELGKPVRNLGVPTYGPPEYNAVLAEQLEKRHAKTVIWVANLANDLFEATRPNRERHVVSDGWAVRAERATKTTSFPGRSLLFNRSHAVVALRRRWFEASPSEGFASEGTWRDIGAEAHGAEIEHATAKGEAVRLDAQHARDLERAQREAKEQAVATERFVEKELTLWERERLGLVKIDDVEPSHPAAEESRSWKVTVRHLRIGAELRKRMEAMVRERGEHDHDARVLDVFAKREELGTVASKLATTEPSIPIVASPLASSIREAKALCDRFGARLLVVALPLDVQVSPEEWKKYGAAPVDMAGSLVLNQDVVAAASSVGAEGYDAFDTLAAAEPGAFLDGDIHMTKKGHEALASGLAKASNRAR